MKLFPFDTRDTKPKLWGLLVLTAVASAAAAVLIALDPAGSTSALCTVAAVYFFFAAAILLYSFREQIRYNPYSYNTIFYFGFALFFLALTVMFTALALRAFDDPEHYSWLGVVGALLDSARDYMLFSAPFLFVFSAALVVSNISLIIREGFRPVNLLGIALAFAVGGGIVFIFFFEREVSGSQREVMIHTLAANIFASVYLYFECMIIGTIVADAIAARHEPETDKDFIIILGCGLGKDGAPSPLLRGRIERAIAFYEKQKAATGKAPVFVTSGGRGADEPLSESAAMKAYLIGRGIPEEKIVEEDLSTDTFENMKFSKKKIAALDPTAKIAFSTTNYHVFRSGLFARRVKMRAVGMGAKTKWYFWPNAAVREFVGLMTKHRVKQALILAGIIAIYVTLTFVAYK